LYFTFIGLTIGGAESIQKDLLGDIVARTSIVFLNDSFTRDNSGQY